MKGNSISYILLISIFSMVACAQTSKTAETTESTTEQAAPIAMNINTDEFARLILEKKDAIILDIRTDAEIAEGFIEGQTQIDFYDEEFREKLGALDRNTPIMVYCRSAGRSTDALGMMSEMGFREVYNLEGGFEAWKAAGKTVTKN